MKCITARTFLLHHSLQHHRKSICSSLSRCEPIRFLWHPQQSLSTKTQTAAAVIIMFSLVLAEVHQPKGDIYVFQQNGRLVFLVYLLSNFVVPSIVSKQLQLDESTAKEPENKSNNNIMEEKLNEQLKKEQSFISAKP